jgi:hypothetical protein
LTILADNTLPCRLSRKRKTWFGLRLPPVSQIGISNDDAAAPVAVQGAKFQQGVKRVCRRINVEIVKRSDTAKFVVLPKRWIVERTIGWLNRCRRLAKDWECLNQNGLVFLRWASIRIMIRRLCQNNK